MNSNNPSRRDLLRSSALVAAPILAGISFPRTVKADPIDPTSGNNTADLAWAIQDHLTYIPQNCFNLSAMENALRSGAAVLGELITGGITPYLTQACRELSSNPNNFQVSSLNYALLDQYMSQMFGISPGYSNIHPDLQPTQDAISA